MAAGDSTGAQEVGCPGAQPGEGLGWQSCSADVQKVDSGELGNTAGSLVQQLEGRSRGAALQNGQHHCDAGAGVGACVPTLLSDVKPLEPSAAAEGDLGNGDGSGAQLLRGPATGEATKVGPVQVAARAAAAAQQLDGIERALLAIMKGFSIGAGLKGGLSLFSLLMRLVRRRNPKAKAASKDHPLDLWQVLHEAFQYGLFVGSFAGSYCWLDWGIARLWGQDRTKGWRALLTGATAGPALLLVGSTRAGKGKGGPGDAHSGHTSLALYIFVRAAVLAVRCGLKSKRWGWLFRPLSYEHGDVLLMCLSSSQILTAWLLEPSSLPSSYVSFLNKHGGKPVPVIHGIRELARSNGHLTPAIAQQITSAWNQGAAASASSKASGLTAMAASAVADSAGAMGSGGGQLLGPGAASSAAAAAVESLTTTICGSQAPCPFIHPGQGCLPHVLSFFSSAYMRAILVYIPVYIVPALVVHRASWLERPTSILGRTMLGTARSSLFLSAYCSSAWLWTCALHQLLNRCTPATLAVGTLPTGLAVLLEKKSRRMELALYCFSRAIESFFICTHRWGWIPTLQPQCKNKRKGKLWEALTASSLALDVCILSCAASVIMYCYANEREVFRSKYLNVLDWVFGRSDSPDDGTSALAETKSF